MGCPEGPSQQRREAQSVSQSSRTLSFKERGHLAFSVCVWSVLSHVQLSVAPWTVAC